jgi:hypothetical protein
MKNKLEKMVNRYRELGIDKQIDYDKFHLYSLITHSTAIEGSTLNIHPLPPYSLIHDNLLRWCQ